MRLNSEAIEKVNKIAEKTGGSAWFAKDENGFTVKARVYYNRNRGGYIEMLDSETANIDKVNRNLFNEAKAACEAAGLKAVRR